MRDLHELFINELSIMYDTEKQILNALPSFISAVHSTKLKKFFTKDLQEVQHQIHRLEMIAKELGRNFSGESSEVMRTLIREAEKAMASDYEELVKEAALINCAQHMEHFEIASYGILKALAKSFQNERIFKLLEESSKEEGAANKELSRIAQGSFFSKGINNEALRRHAA
jgi:ferritin-like metal-binding protein YciE